MPSLSLPRRLVAPLILTLCAGVTAPLPASFADRLGDGPLAALVIAAPAAAGTYDVTACGSAPGGAVTSWTRYDVDGMAANASCPATGDHDGMVARTGVNNSVNTCGTCSAYWDFIAPPGTSIERAYLAYTGFSRDDTYRTGLFTNGMTMVEGCGYGAASAAGGLCQFTSDGWRTFGAGTDLLRFSTECNGSSNCSMASTGLTPPWRVGVAVSHAIVRLTDTSQPSHTLTGGGIVTGGWLRGSQSVTFTGSDNAGIRVKRLRVDGAEQSAETRTCNFAFTVPCSSAAANTYSVDTAALADGPHSVTVEVADPAGNLQSSTRTITVDNTAPGQVPQPAVAAGDDWRSTNSFDVDFQIPAGQVSPVVRAHYELCTTGPTPVCSTGAQAGSGITRLSNLSVPGVGDHTLRVHLEDAAGNRSAATASSAAHLRYDNMAPGEADPQRSNGWIGDAEARSFDQRIELKGGAFVPVSLIRGYSVTRDGSVPDNSLDVTGTTYTVTNLPEGLNAIRARAISGAGVASPQVGTTTVAVDRSAPTTAVTGAPAADHWQQSAVTLTLAGSDQAGLSGMLGADPSAPISQGAYLGYRLDGGPLERIRGAQGPLTLDTDGAHTLTYHGVDVAGNASAERSVTVRIDATAPELVAFEAQTLEDPRTIQVAASDRTSGVAGGVVELRRASTGTATVARSAQVRRTAATDEGWRALPTTLAGERLLAATGALEEGTYELRARVTDVAGNERVSTLRRDGAPMIVRAPLPDPGTSPGSSNPGGADRPGEDSRRTGPPSATRGDARLSAGFTRAKATRCTKAKRRPRRARRSTALPTPRATAAAKRTKRPRRRAKRCAKPAPGQLAQKLTVAMGKKASVRGQLTGAGDRPLAGSAVTVWGRATSPREEWRRIGQVATDRDGRFTYALPPGPSRTVRLAYEQGTTTAIHDLTVAVAASTTITVDRRSLRLGQTLTLSGRVAAPGTALPRGGKLVDLQAHDRGKWRKFATVRSRQNGLWRHRYRFEATRGTVTYPFRAVLRREAAFPFETGTSRSVKVTVRGR